MNRAARRARQKQQAQRAQSYPAELTAIPREQWPAGVGDGPAPRTRVFLSQRFLVQEFAEPNGVMRLSVNRTTVDRNGSWNANIAWEDLQEIKDALGYADRDAVEVFPRHADLVNVANMRHLWVLPEPLPFGWRAK